MIAIGSRVRVTEPFNNFYPDVYEVTGQNPDTGAWQILEGIDFDESNLTEETE